MVVLHLVGLHFLCSSVLCERRCQSLFDCKSCGLFRGSFCATAGGWDEPAADRHHDSLGDRLACEDDPARSIQRSQSGGGGLVQYAPKTTWRSAVMTPDEWPSTD
eukprot:TRINITY_DN30216_c0_g1_i1.p4 TRINITY_DN30216_c0_g1~~TRINITY_DN30216_c0_g1_i1.p4  ORF type:complete len:105 (-),score=0.24 TRINITY_DN30216_c0_g1_i1:603-917(-)